MRRNVLAKDLADSASNIKQGSLEDVRCQSKERRVCEANRIVALTKGLGVVDASGQVGQVNASKAVDCTHVAADGESFRNLELQQVVLDSVAWNGVIDTNRTTVPVLAIGEPLASCLPIPLRREKLTGCARFLSGKTAGLGCRLQRRTI